MIGRRSFLAGILGAAAAPAIVRAESLMKIAVPKREILVPLEIGVIERFRFIESPALVDPFREAYLQQAVGGVSGLSMLMDADRRMRAKVVGWMELSEYGIHLTDPAQQRTQ